jgi:hypothetical protein
MEIPLRGRSTSKRVQSLASHSVSHDLIFEMSPQTSSESPLSNWERQASHDLRMPPLLACLGCALQPQEVSSTTPPEPFLYPFPTISFRSEGKVNSERQSISTTFSASSRLKPKVSITSESPSFPGNGLEGRIFSSHAARQESSPIDTHFHAFPPFGRPRHPSRASRPLSLSSQTSKRAFKGPMSDEIYSSSENEASPFDFEKYLARCIEDRRTSFREV